MEKKSRLLASVVIVFLIAYFMAGLVGVLPAQYDLIGNVETGVETPVITEYPIPSQDYTTTDIVVDRTTGNVWFTESWNYPYDCKICRLTQEGVFTEFTLNGYKNLQSIDIDSNGNLWFNENNGNKVGKMTQDGQLTEYSVGSGSYMNDLCIYQQTQDIWIIEQNLNRISSLTQSGTYTPYTIPTTNSNSISMAIDQSTGNIWFSEFNGNKIGKMTQQGQFTEYPVPQNDVQPYGIAFNSKTNSVWFTQIEQELKVVEMDSEGAFTDYQKPNPTSPTYSVEVEQTSGDVWFTEVVSNTTVRLTQQDVLTTFYVPTPDSTPDKMAIDGERDNVWFIEIVGKKIGKITGIYAQEEPETSPQIIQQEEITATITQTGTDGYAKIGDTIPVEVNLECPDGIETAQVVYTPITDGTYDTVTKTVDMVLISGTNENGVWRGEIPAQEGGGTLSFYVYATSETGGELRTPTTYVTITEQGQETPTPSAPSADLRTVFYAGTIGILLIVGIAINRPPARWKY